MKPALIVFILCASGLARAAELAPVVEIEEDVYTYTNANNGAGPMWCSGSTSMVRVGDEWTFLDRTGDWSAQGQLHWP
jgi:hypothetical protein